MAKQKTDDTNGDTSETTKTGRTPPPPTESAPPAEPTLADLDARLQSVEHAVHALDTHQGTSHIGFTDFVKKFRDRYWPKG